MASFLVLAQDLPNAGKVEGDPISVKDESEAVATSSGTWLWSAEEDINRWIAEGNPRGQFPGLFYVVNVLDLPIERARRALHAHERPAIPGQDSEANAPDLADRFVKLGPCRWRFDIDAGMTAGERQSIRRDRRLDLSRSRVNTVIVDRTADDVIDTDNPRDRRLAAQAVGVAVRMVLRG